MSGTRTDQSSRANLSPMPNDETDGQSLEKSITASYKQSMQDNQQGLGISFLNDPTSLMSGSGMPNPLSAMSDTLMPNSNNSNSSKDSGPSLDSIMKLFNGISSGNNASIPGMSAGEGAAVGEGAAISPEMAVLLL